MSLDGPSSIPAVPRYDPTSSTPAIPRHDPTSHPAHRVPSPPPQHRSRFGSIAHPGRSRHNSTASGAHQAELDPQDRYVDLTGAAVPRPDLDGFRPVAGFRFSSPASASGIKARSRLALSSVGFLAASNEASLIVVDLRGPEVVLVDVPGTSAPSSKGKGKIDSSAITALSWSICAIGEGASYSPSLSRSAARATKLTFPNARRPRPLASTRRHPGLGPHARLRALQRRRLVVPEREVRLGPARQHSGRLRLVRPRQGRQRARRRRPEPAARPHAPGCARHCRIVRPGGRHHEPLGDRRPVDLGVLLQPRRPSHRHLRGRARPVREGRRRTRPGLCRARRAVAQLHLVDVLAARPLLHRSSQVRHDAPVRLRPALSFHFSFTY